MKKILDIIVIFLFILNIFIFLETRKSNDEIIQEKIAIIEQSQRTPTPETLAIAEIAKVELAEIHTKKQKEQYFKNTDSFSNRVIN